MAKKKRGWELIGLLALALSIFGLIGGVIAASSGRSFLYGFTIFSVPPLAIALSFTAYAFAIGYVVKRLGGDPENGAFAMALYLSYAFLVIPLAVVGSKALGITLRW